MEVTRTVKGDSYDLHRINNMMGWNKESLHSVYSFEPKLQQNL